MAVNISPALLPALNDHHVELEILIAECPDWSKAAAVFNAFFQSLSNPEDPLWSSSNFAAFKKAYFEARDGDKGMSNITLRTLAYLPRRLKKRGQKDVSANSSRLRYF